MLEQYLKRLEAGESLTALVQEILDRAAKSPAQAEELAGIARRLAQHSEAIAAVKASRQIPGTVIDALSLSELTIIVEGVIAGELVAEDVKLALLTLLADKYESNRTVINATTESIQVLFTGQRLQPLNQLDRDFIRALQSANVRELLGTNDRLADDVTKTILEGIADGKQVDQIGKQVAELNTEQLKSDARTVVRTQIRSVQREVKTVKGIRVGGEFFQYVGVIQSNTRNFCKGLLLFRQPAIYHISEITGGGAFADNGQLNPVIRHGGGYNCTHDWQVVANIRRIPKSLASLFISMSEVSEGAKIILRETLAA